MPRGSLEAKGPNVGVPQKPGPDEPGERWIGLKGDTVVNDEKPPACRKPRQELGDTVRPRRVFPGIDIADAQSNAPQALGEQDILIHARGYIEASAENGKQLRLDSRKGVVWGFGAGSE
jgi:hypothetical protein